MDELTIDLILFSILTPLVAVNIVALSLLMWRLHQEHRRDLRPLMSAIFLCHLSTFILSLTFVIAFGVQKFGTVADVIAVQDYLRAMFYVALAVMFLESFSILYWRFIDR